MGYNVIGMWKFKWGANEGFTLMELIITIGIIAVLSAGVMTAIGPGPKQTARDGNRQSALAQVISALEIYRSDRSSYPKCASGANCQFSGISNTNSFLTNYLPTAPVEPSSGRIYSYIPLPAGCDESTTRCTSYRLCASLEKNYASLPVIAACTGSCGTNCNYSVIGP